LIIIIITEVAGINSQIDLKQELLALELLGILKEDIIALDLEKLVIQKRSLVVRDQN
jgi:hypothetical protein